MLEKLHQNNKQILKKWGEYEYLLDIGLWFLIFLTENAPLYWKFSDFLNFENRQWDHFNKSSTLFQSKPFIVKRLTSMLMLVLKMLLTLHCLSFDVVLKFNQSSCSLHISRYIKSAQRKSKQAPAFMQQLCSALPVRKPSCWERCWWLSICWRKLGCETFTTLSGEHAVSKLILLHFKFAPSFPIFAFPPLFFSFLFLYFPSEMCTFIMCKVLRVYRAITIVLSSPQAITAWAYYRFCACRFENRLIKWLICACPTGDDSA